jgi:hypothetical protein
MHALSNQGLEEHKNSHIPRILIKRLMDLLTSRLKLQHLIAWLILFATFNYTDVSGVSPPKRSGFTPADCAAYHAGSLQTSLLGFLSNIFHSHDINQDAASHLVVAQDR